MKETPYTYRQTLKTPAPISCLAEGSSGHFFAGSDDGSVRVYNQETLKVVKAIRGLGEVSSVVCMAYYSASGLGDIWVASNRHALRFTVDTEKMILAKADATLTLELGAENDDVLNELSLNQKNSQLAFCLDSGAVGVVDLSTKQVTRMKTSHDNICGTVKFIPDRPSELVSGGYDSRLLHHDFHQKTILSRFDLGTSPLSESSGVSMSPPFILSSAMSPSGILAAGTADGRVWIGTGGEKMIGVSSGASVKKKRRKWEGLKQDGAFTADVGHGPITALTFFGPRTLFTSTLMGKVTLHEIGGPTADGKLDISPKWTKATTDVNKVNAIIATKDLIIIGGLSETGGGITEVWEKSGDV
ncbi:WD40-repeat-containing domain protein [Suillus fuscotomentosus]|uniref:WD40-repeat-containing domain protein n=1 Tax=Suillus fuscotomentosus TaxID=1912939 RepID=A0AAD4DX31_9AGAM|nr:WD40-repeat-containing domain protein [Suillus fuscotomentosus]KAG1895675.1 WD40-repeat-containing domain protein [Suillus fuscotomentosus]